MEAEFVVFAIPMMGILLGFFGVWTAHKQKLAKLEIEARKHGAGQSTLGAQHIEEMREMQQRLRVLERIVTDGGYNVATEIEALRDQRRVEDYGAGVPLDINRKERA